MQPTPDLNDLAERARGLAAADAVDALVKMFDHRSHISGLIGPVGNKPILGPALTVSFMPVRRDIMDKHRHSLGPAIYRAVADHDPKGAVLVISSNGHPTTSLGGSTKLSRVKNLEMAGVVCDGFLRDFDELAEYPFSSYCNGEAIRAGGNEIQPYLADVPVNVAGVTILPGDIIFADETGVAIIPADKAGEILDSAQKIKAMGYSMRSIIAAEDPADVLKNGSKEL